MRKLLSIGLITLLAGCGDGVAGGDSGAPEDAGNTSPRDSGGGPSCVDEDGDGYGVGCARGADCDDDAASVSPAATEVCNGIDDDCDGRTDEDILTPRCALTEGVCAGATARCGPHGFLECDATDYGADYEADETRCDGLDNDCDGSTDEVCPCEEGATQSCGSDVGACMTGTQTCTDERWGACEGEVAPMGEVCDGLDNDCDGSTDELADLTPPDCPLQLGVCAGSRRTCGGVAGWIACSGIASYGGDYQATETLCDGLDNDCDGVADEGCTCTDGSTQPCGSDIGACVAGIQTCVAGSWGACAGEVPGTPETCNGEDDDCDGRTDEGLVAPACELTLGVCAGSSQRCSGAGGFVACGAAEYGPSYEATESLCDGLDNDCDGSVDEGCGCSEGATQPCGPSTGICARGTQTCVGGQWGACTGGVGAQPERCNGLDDDCDGSSDDDLTPPPCALTLGVCAGAVQTCGGASGWQACAGTASYGPRYLEVEDGFADSSVCDGLDNDCNGVVDDSCVSGPLVRGPEDAVTPDIYNRHLVYSANLDGNWDVLLLDLNDGTERRLTTTPEDELFPSVSGNQVVFVRGSDTPAARAVLYDLVTDTETVLSTRETGSVSIGGAFVAWDETDGTQWDVVVYDLEDGTRTTIGAATTDEFGPSVRGGRLAYMSTAPGIPLVHVAEYDGGWGAPSIQSGGGGVVGQGSTAVDFVAVAWTDGSAVTGTPHPMSDWDVYAAPFGAAGGLVAWPGGNAIDLSTGAQILRDMDSLIMVWDDHALGDWNVGTAMLGDVPLRVTTSPTAQVGPRVSGNYIVWYDNRLGSFDIYASVFLGATFAPDEGSVLIFEVLADPATGADANGDGVASATDDEFVEIINVTAVTLDLSGMTLSDSSGVRHTFPPGTFLPAFGIAVVFGGGTPVGPFGGAVVDVASSGSLALDDSGDTLTLRSSDGITVDVAPYGAEANMDQSIVRLDTAAWVLHGSLSGAYSPGTLPTGSAP